MSKQHYILLVLTLATTYLASCRRDKDTTALLIHAGTYTGHCTYETFLNTTTTSCTLKLEQISNDKFIYYLNGNKQGECTITNNNIKISLNTPSGTTYTGTGICNGKDCHFTRKQFSNNQYASQVTVTTSR
jgi:hypothetical protein